MYVNLLFKFYSFYDSGAAELVITTLLYNICL